MGKFTTLLRATGLAVTLAMPAAAQDASTVLATVNGTDITLGHLIALQKQLPDEYKQIEDARLFNGILEQLIQQTALQQEVEDSLSTGAQFGLDNELRAFMASEYLTNASNIEIPAEDIAAVYEAQFGALEPEEEFNASHILVETEDEAKGIIDLISKGGDFAELAKQKSTGPSGPGGGALGWFGKGQMVPAFEAAVVALDEGGVSEPVNTQFGWHVVKLNERRSIAAPSLDEVRSQIIEQLRGEALQNQIEAVTAAAEITRTEEEIDPALIRKVELLEDK